MRDLQFSLFLAANGWAVYEVATKRVVEIDGVRQAGLRFPLAEQAARLLNQMVPRIDPSSLGLARLKRNLQEPVRP